MGYINYADSMPADQLSPSESSKVIAHYTASVQEFKTGEFHVCDLCRPHLLKQFFRGFENMTEANAQEVQELAFNLGVTADEFNRNAQTRDRAENIIYGENPFIKEAA